MNDQDLHRYARHINLAGFGYDAQRRLHHTSAIVVGLGGLGSAAALYLAAAGVKRLHFVDFDRVERSNLQRQIVHTDHRLGDNKADSAKAQCLALNPSLNISSSHSMVNADNVIGLVQDYDIIVDCCDNFTARHALNRASVTLQIPLVSAAAIRFEGQLAVFDPRQKDSPCYACLYPENHQQRAETCSADGILGPVVGLLGVAQALETIKVLAAVGQPLIGKLCLFDALQFEWQTITLPKHGQCPVCTQGTVQK